ncbi:hypothetical protein RDI58_018161 [Solanum bulbocastanum]|uniref:Uncharacterized protein n=1 Tax=Solanum bulbocastanum TaxID=147425 RepID=A0AAN8YAN9_SOLBU
MSMGGGVGLMAPMKFSVVTKKTSMIVSPGKLWRRSWIHWKLKQAKKKMIGLCRCLKSIKKASPIGLKITLRSVGRKI